MNSYKVMLEGRCFSACIDGRERLLGFYTTVELMAHNHQELKRVLEVALISIIEANGLRVLNRPHQMSFCRIQNVYSIDNQKSFAEQGGITLFYEKHFNSVFLNLIRIFFTTFRSNEMVKLSR